MVDDLDDVHLLRALHGLRQLVVIDEDDLAADFFEEVGFRQDADGALVFVDDGKRLEVRRGGHRLDGVEVFVRAEAEVAVVDHVPDGHRRAAEHRGGGGVVRREQQADFLLLREVHHRGRDGQSAGDDEDADAFRDGEVLDFQAVPDDDDELFARVVIQASREGLGVHRADHEDQILFLVGVHGEHHGPAEGPVEVAQRGDDAA